MQSSEVAILNLLGSYAEAIDSGNLEGASSLFEHALVKVAGMGELRSWELLHMWQSWIILYPDGTPRTKHVITNPIIEVDEDAGSATCRSYYSVLQQVDGMALQLVCAGRYHDRFERVDGTWRYAYRDYSLLDLVGDTSRHLKQGPPS